MLDNDTFLRALKREPTPYTPIWLMRQAGRYLPEYKATRNAAGSFMGLAGNPGLATEVTLQPLERFPLDAAILFSDILTIPDAMGLGLSFAEGEGPRFARTTRDEAAIKALAVPDMAKLRYVFDAVAEIKRALKGSVPLIGFAGSPFTLACYMIEGGGAWLAEIAAIGAAAVGLDWTVDMAAARRTVGNAVALQGNLDPAVLLTDPATVAREATRILHDAGPAPGHIFNLGHGIMQGTPPDNVAALVETVHRISRATRAAP